jgi:hypothetical protein
VYFFAKLFRNEKFLYEAFVPCTKSLFHWLFFGEPIEKPRYRPYSSFNNRHYKVPEEDEQIRYEFESFGDSRAFIDKIMEYMDVYGFCTIGQADKEYHRIAGKMAPFRSYTASKYYGWNQLLRKDIDKSFRNDMDCLVVTITMPHAEEVSK